jgi:hypothetical protein
MIKLILALAIVGCTSLSAAVPATQPTGESVDTLIKQLGSGSSSERRRARDELVRLGEATLPHLQAAAQNATDSETRSGIEVVLKRLAERNEYGPTLITLHARGAGPELFDAIGKQSGVRFTPFDKDTWPVGQPDPAVSVDFDHTPFWDAVSMLAQRCGVRPTGEYRHSSLDAAEFESGPQVIAGEVQLKRFDPQPPREYAGAASGAFYVYAHALTVPRARDRWALRMSAIAEPKLTPVFWSVIKTHVIDDKGVEAKNPQSTEVESMWGRTPEVSVDFTLSPGATRIAKFTAETRVMASAATEKLQIPELAKAAGTSWPWSGLRIDIEGFEELKDGSFRLMLNIIRGGLDEAHFQECYYVVASVPIQLLDRENRPLLQDAGSMSLLEMNGMPVDHIRVFRTFTRDTLFAKDPRPRKPVKLVWELPSRLHAYDVPVLLTDIPDSRLK